MKDLLSEFYKISIVPCAMCMFPCDVYLHASVHSIIYRGTLHMFRGNGLNA